MNELVNYVQDYASGKSRRSPFYLFEPWDVEKRPDWIVEMMKKDGVFDTVAGYGTDPHPFQSGIIFGNDPVSAIFAGTQTGKSYPVMIDLIIQCTGEIPYSLRYPKGFDTGVKREITTDNINRFGRFRDGKFLDNNISAEEDGSWDCGTIIGCGEYPREKLFHPFDVAWIGTFKQARDENWWRELKKLIPIHCLDSKKGSGGYNTGDHIIHFMHDIELHIITYEQGFDRFESKKVRRCVLDEEPPDERIFVAALGHCHQLTLVETPYRGFTYTFTRIREAAKESGGIKFYHCIQYDSPYQTRKTITLNRKFMPQWEIEARVYGLHSHQVGRPYYHELFDNIKSWIQKFVNRSTRYTIVTPEYTNPSDVCRLNVRGVKSTEGEWNVLEEPKENLEYYISIDTARGDEGEDKRVDANVAYVFRKPLPEEDQSRPVEVAYCRTQIETKPFARLVLAAASWYNNAMIAPEAKGMSAGVFINEIHGYPFIYMMTVMDDRTKKSVERLGFCTSGKTRPMIFSEIGELMVESIERECPFKSKDVLEELLELVVSKGGRPDHPKGGKSDCVIAYGIGLYVYRFDRNQIRNNNSFRIKKSNNEVDKWNGRFISKVTETRPILGSRRGLDERSRRK